ncbi:MAG TPA: hypothetical protein VKU84_19735 [Stellaceae bacterium]|nr:hypothetical protein [Stellaceae bacterium]
MSGTAEGSRASREDGNSGFLANLVRSIGLSELFASHRPDAVSPSPALAPRLAILPKPVRRRATSSSPRDTQAFQFDVGATVYPTTGGVVTTEGVDGVDVVTVDALHHRIIHPAAFFVPHDGARYDRRAVESFWPIKVGKHVHFIETSGTHRWLNVMSAVRVETVKVPAGVFRTFVIERTNQSLAPGPRPVATFTYWYAPEAGTIVKLRTEAGDGSAPMTEEADVLGYPLSRPSTASASGLE